MQTINLVRFPVRRDVLPEYEDDLMGLPVVLINAAIREMDEETGEEAIFVPNLDELAAAMALARCHNPLALTRQAIHFLREALDMTVAEFGAFLGIDHAEAAQWESNPYGTDPAFEKTVRARVCARLQPCAPGVRYDPEAIAGLDIRREDQVAAVEPQMRFTRNRQGQKPQPAWVLVD